MHKTTYSSEKNQVVFMEIKKEEKIMKIKYIEGYSRGVMSNVLDCNILWASSIFCH